MKNPGTFSQTYFRLFICPMKLKFMLDPMNVVDMFTLLPFYLAILLEELEDYEIIGKAGKMIRLLKVIYKTLGCKGVYRDLLGGGAKHPEFFLTPPT